MNPDEEDRRCYRCCEELHSAAEISRMIARGLWIHQSIEHLIKKLHTACLPLILGDNNA